MSTEETKRPAPERGERPREPADAPQGHPDPATPHPDVRPQPEPDAENLVPVKHEPGTL